MQLSPLQSRLVASLAASLFVLGTYWLLFGPNFALAADLPLRSDPHLDIDLDLELDQPIARADQLPSSSYEPEFGLFDRGIIGRQAVEAQPIGKDTPERWTLNPGESRCYLLSKSEIFGSDSSGRRRGAEHDDTAGIGGQPDESEEERVRRQTRGTTNVYVSATTCLQPNLTNQDAQTRYPGPLRMLVSTSQDVGCPTTTQGMDSNMWDDFEEGLVELTVRADDSPVYVNVVAPKVSKDFEGPYDFEVALSLNSSYHSFDRPTEVRTNLVWMDSDSSAALLLTSDLTDDESDVDRVMAIDPPYELYVEDQNRPVFEGIRRSRCGMEQQAMIVANRNGDGRGHSMVRTSLTTRGTGGMPKQQFYFEGLEETSNYTAVLVQVASLGPNDVFGKRQEAPGRNSRRYMVSEPIEFRTLAGEITSKTPLLFLTKAS
jgi:calcium channel MID1